MKSHTKPNTAFWIIAILALLWNLIGIYFWLYEYFLITDDIRATLPAGQVELMDAAPAWGMVVYGIAVFSGVLASILLIARKKLCVPIFLISLLAILVQMGHWIFAMDAVGVLGPEAIVMPLIVIAIAIFLYYYSKGAALKGWLR
tara:strand:+ start:194 stop:628 length:435 start_codon:yes stop_codon:yes gene_type:complete